MEQLEVGKWNSWRYEGGAVGGMKVEQLDV